MVTVETIVVALALLTVIAMTAATVLFRRNPTIRAARSLFDERLRQMQVEGYSRLRDDIYTGGDLARAASEYAAASATGGNEVSTVCQTPRPEWPWGGKHWKPKSRRDCLIKAGALVIAEIERLDRLEVHRD